LCSWPGTSSTTVLPRPRGWPPPRSRSWPSAWLTSWTATAGSPPTPTSMLLTRIYAFIQQHLGDPELSPGAVAAAHHISVSYLHKLFHAEGATVAGWGSSTLGISAGRSRRPTGSDHWTTGGPAVSRPTAWTDREGPFTARSRQSDPNRPQGVLHKAAWRGSARAASIRIHRRSWPAARCSSPAANGTPGWCSTPSPGWFLGRVTLLGDAAHPMYSVGSNGASQAILEVTAPVAPSGSSTSWMREPPTASRPWTRWPATPSSKRSSRATPI
jgi:hypothetical protein